MMESQHDPLGIIALTSSIEKLCKLLEDNTGLNSDPFADLVPEAEFSKKVQVSASTLRQWRKDGTLKDCWVKRGKHIWWSPRIFREELLPKG